VFTGFHYNDDQAHAIYSRTHAQTDGQPENKMPSAANRWRRHSGIQVDRPLN